MGRLLQDVQVGTLEPKIIHLKQQVVQSLFYITKCARVLSYFVKQLNLDGLKFRIIHVPLSFDFKRGF